MLFNTETKQSKTCIYMCVCVLCSWLKSAYIGDKAYIYIYNMKLNEKEFNFVIPL